MYTLLLCALTRMTFTDYGYPIEYRVKAPHRSGEGRR